MRSKFLIFSDWILRFVWKLELVVCNDSEGGMMLLCIDVGNTHTQFGVYEKKRLKRDYRVASEVVRTEDEIGIVVLALLEHHVLSRGAL